MIHLLFESREEAEKNIPKHQIRKLKIDGFTFCLANTQKAFIAFDKECPHLQDELSRGNLNIHMEVVCPWHSYRFSLHDGQESQQRCDALKIYPTHWEEGRLLVDI